MAKITANGETEYARWADGDRRVVLTAKGGEPRRVLVKLMAGDVYSLRAKFKRGTSLTAAIRRVEVFFAPEHVRLYGGR